MAPSQLVPESFVGLLGDIPNSYTIIVSSEVPSIVAHNPLWRRCGLREKCQTVRLMCHSDSLTALLLDLKSGDKVVLKAWPKTRMEGCMQQIEAEKQAARLFCSPLTATVLAVGTSSHHGVCCLSPYVGSSMDNILCHQHYPSIPMQDKLQLLQVAATCILTTLADMEQAAGCPLVYRDVKPENFALDPTSGLGKVFDFGLMMRVSGEDYTHAMSFGYHPPEVRLPGLNGQYDTFYNPSCCKALLKYVGNKWDSFLFGFTMLEALVPLPWELQAASYDIDSEDEAVAEAEYMRLIQAHDAADLPALVAQVPDPLARQALLALLERQPALRLSPSEALQQLPWFAEVLPQVQQTVAAATPAHLQRCQALVDQLQQGLWYKSSKLFFAQPMSHMQQQQHCDSCSQAGSVAEPGTPNRSSNSYSYSSGCVWMSELDTPSSSSSDCTSSCTRGAALPSTPTICSSIPAASSASSSFSSCGTQSADSIVPAPSEAPAAAASAAASKCGMLKRGLKALQRALCCSSKSKQHPTKSSPRAQQLEADDCKVSVPGSFCGLLSFKRTCTSS